MQKNDHPVIMTIATSDSGGGAGIQADIKTIMALGGFGVSVFAALTAQNGVEVRGIYEIPEDFILLQLATITDGFPVKAAKTGMLFSSKIMETLSPELAKKNFPLVVDPVCASQSGYRLIEQDAVDSMKKYIIPFSDLLTPNIPEAELLTGISIKTEKDIAGVIECLLDMGAKAVLLKGGHFIATGDTIVDWLGTQGEPPLALAHKRVDTMNNHGTGCTLSAAIATGLGFGKPLITAIKDAQSYLGKALAESFTPGIGVGPPNFLV